MGIGLGFTEAGKESAYVIKHAAGKDALAAWFFKKAPEVDVVRTATHTCDGNGFVIVSRSQARCDFCKTPLLPSQFTLRRTF